MMQLDKIFREGLARQQSVAPELVHPDADHLTAFLEQALSQPERQHVMQHLSRCVNCRDTVALSMPELDLMPIAVAEPQASIWRRWLVFRWAAAAAAIVVVAGTVTLYQANQRHQVATIIDGPDAIASMKARQARPTEFTQTDSVTKTDATETRAADRSQAAAQPVMTAELQDHVAAPAREKAAPSKADETATLMEKVVVQSAPMAPPPVSAAAAATSPNVSSPAKVATLDRPVEVRGGVLAGAGALAFPPGSGRALRPSEEPPLQSYDQPDRVFTTTAETRPQRGISFGGRGTEAAAKTLARHDPMAVGMFSAPPLPNAPSLNRRWKVTNEGQLQRSHAIGEDFHTVPVADGIFFKSVAESGSEVWAGGVGGALYHSTDDGKSWMKLMPSAGDQPLFADIIAIHATQRGAAELLTSNNEHWITVDGGQHWARRE